MSLFNCPRCDQVFDSDLDSCFEHPDTKELVCEECSIKLEEEKMK